MTLLQAVVLGLVQGLTEFLPISSSGHLVLLPHFLNWKLNEEEVFIFVVLVQWGTLLAVFVYFWSELLNIGRAMLTSIKERGKASAMARLGWLILLSTVPSIAVGLLVRNQVKDALVSPSATGIFLLVTALLLVLAEVFGKHNKGLQVVGIRGAIVIGLFQVLSLLPGISRSGATISGGMMNHLRRRAAARYAFLMAVPVMISAGVLALLDLGQLSNGAEFLPMLAIGFLVASVVGYLAIRWLLIYLSARSLVPFAIYCTALGLAAIFSS